jgi:hypothetical protein
MLFIPYIILLFWFYPTNVHYYKSVHLSDRTKIKKTNL